MWGCGRRAGRRRLEDTTSAHYTILVLHLSATIVYELGGLGGYLEGVADDVALAVELVELRRSPYVRIGGSGGTSGSSCEACPRAI